MLVLYWCCAVPSSTLVWNRQKLERNFWCVLKTEIYDSKYLPCDRPSNSRGQNGTESLLEETFEFRHSFKNYCCIQNGAFKSKRQLNDYNNGMLRYYSAFKNLGAAPKIRSFLEIFRIIFGKKTKFQNCPIKRVFERTVQKSCPET